MSCQADEPITGDASAPSAFQSEDSAEAKDLERELAYFKDINIKLEAALLSKDAVADRLRYERGLLRELVGSEVANEMRERTRKLYGYPYKRQLEEAQADTATEDAG
jgi:hypothetical protein